AREQELCEHIGRAVVIPLGKAIAQLEHARLRQFYRDFVYIRAGHPAAGNIAGELFYLRDELAHEGTAGENEILRVGARNVLAEVGKAPSYPPHESLLFLGCELYRVGELFELLDHAEPPVGNIAYILYHGHRA